MTTTETARPDASTGRDPGCQVIKATEDGRPGSEVCGLVPSHVVVKECSCGRHKGEARVCDLHIALNHLNGYCKACHDDGLPCHPCKINLTVQP